MGFATEATANETHLISGSPVDPMWSQKTEPRCPLLNARTGALPEKLQLRESVWMRECTHAAHGSLIYRAWKGRRGAKSIY